MNKLQSIVLFLGVLASVQLANGQEATANGKTRIKIDGVAAVIGDYAILESDIDKSYIDLQTQGVDVKNISRCEVLGKLMEDKLYAHQAIQDSIVVDDAHVRSYGENQINYLIETKFQTLDRLLEFYKSESEESFKEKLFEANKIKMLSDKMKEKIIEEMDITPDEIRQFFDDIPEEDLPVFGAELEIAQIVKNPEIPEAEKQKVVQRLQEIRSDVMDNGSSFNVKAILYSKDPASAPKGGFYKITKQTPFVKEFKDIAFSLAEGEISEPFETIYGFHIIKIDKIRGQELDLRHILLVPEIPQWSVEKAKDEIEGIRTKIQKGELTFEEAARLHSDEKETKHDGGQLRNPTNFDTRFELTKLDPTFYNQVRNLDGDQISDPIIYRDERTQKMAYKIIRVTGRYDEHRADYAKDYIKIKDLALQEKKYKAIQKWMREKIEETFISINGTNRECDFQNNWLKK
ncbi:MAG: peptidylprolyl isomerase [Flavobacteriaceae bacterium]|nr:peptidylprolyl isomerase [Flavobacteriaceae bacterium]